MDFNSLLTDHLRLTDYQTKALKRLNIKTTKDLLWHFPSRYEELGEMTTVADALENEKVTICGTISGLKAEKTWKKKMNITKATLNDGTGKIRLTWFHQPFVSRLLKNGDYVSVSGKLQKKNGNYYLANPTYEKISAVESKTAGQKLLAIYPETRGLSSLWFRHNIQKILHQVQKNKTELPDIIPPEILKKYKLPKLHDALVYIHTPKKGPDAEAAQKRFSFEEILKIQLLATKKRKEYKGQPSFIITNKKEDEKEFRKNFPFALTKAQDKVTEQILKDLTKNSPMSRFLEGDVGSGKTVIAAIASFAVFKNGHQTAYMAPTEVLAKQIFESYCEYFQKYQARIGLMTSSGCQKFPSKVQYQKNAKISKTQMLKWIASGEIDIIIGTHSLIQDKVKFSDKNKKVYAKKKIALVIIDEQHRFGTKQRATLVNKKNENDTSLAPHFLSMSATPIPRTLALTVYGDLDLSILDETPPGRKKVITEIVPPPKRNEAYDKIREEIEAGRQAYVICPRIEADSSKQSLLSLNMKAVKEEYEKLSTKIFPEYEIAMLYGKMKAEEKDQIIKNFAEGQTNILVSTSVIEVGFNIPEATTIIIEGAERFGLAQLHQLRGRVQRSTYRPFCFIFTESKTAKTLERLSALTKAKNGFELAEYDLKFRGPGELAGKKQWGISDVGMLALKNIKMVEFARQEAQNILKKDPELTKHPEIKKQISDKQKIHFE